MNVQTFQDIFKKSFISDQSAMGLSIIDIIGAILISTLLAIVVVAVYRWSFQGVVYSQSFAVTMLGMSVITCVMIKTISSNVVLSLGMVGALSIVRFRAAIKDPKDIMFVFWSICVGITCGAGLYSLGIISTVCIGALILGASKIKMTRSNYLVVLRYENRAHREVMRIFGNMAMTIKSRVVNKDMSELTVEIELTTAAKQTGFISQFSDIEGVEYATIVHYNGEYAE
jgi:uncharacterized membrane protein YhiD involved in acid resistance